MTGGIGVYASITARPSLVKPMIGLGPAPAHVVASLPRTKSTSIEGEGTNRGHRRNRRDRLDGTEVGLGQFTRRILGQNHRLPWPTSTLRPLRCPGFCTGC